MLIYANKMSQYWKIVLFFILLKDNIRYYYVYILEKENKSSQLFETVLY